MADVTGEQVPDPADWTPEEEDEDWDDYICTCFDSWSEDDDDE